MEKITHQIIKSIDSYYNDLSFKGDDFIRLRDIMFVVMALEAFNWLLDHEYNSFAERLRKQIEKYISLHPWIALYRPVSNDNYKNVNSTMSTTVWRRVYDEIGYDNITIDVLPL